MADVNAAVELHRAILDVLLEKIEADPYPSVTMMNMAEALLRPDDVVPYAQLLIDKIKADTFPSIDLLRRVTSFA